MNYKELELTLIEKIAFYMSMLILGTLIGWLFYDSIFIGIIISFLLFSLKKEYVNYLIQQRNQELLLQFKDLLYSISSSISLGRSLKQALIDSRIFWMGTYEETDYMMIELDDMQTKMEKSNEQEIMLLEDFAKRTGLEDMIEMVTVCKICKKSGGNFSRALSKCNDIIGDKIIIERELQTVMVQKKFEGRIVALMPFIIIASIKFFSPSYLNPLIETSTGRILSTISLALIFIAWISIERVNNIEI